MSTLARIAAGALVGVALACTSTQVVHSEPVASAARVVRPAAGPLTPTATPVGVVMTAAPRYLPVSDGARHNAFPSATLAPDGRLQLVWRAGTDHAVTRDGRIMSAYSSDQGQTWTTPTTLASGYDFRDPSISYIDGHSYLTFFTGTNSSPAGGAWVSRDGGQAVRIDSLPYTAISAPVVKLPDGRLATSFYGRKAGETIDTAWMAWSSDGGSSWSTNRILNDGASHAEPVLLVRNGITQLIARGGTNTLVARTSPDSGRTWDTPRTIVTACTGRPSGVVTADGVMVAICRGALPAVNAQTVYSLDGVQWWTGPTVLPAPSGSPLGMTYAALVEVLPGTLWTTVGMEQADGSSALYDTYLAEAVR